LRLIFLDLTGDLQLKDEDGFSWGVEDLFQSDDVWTGAAQI